MRLCFFVLLACLLAGCGRSVERVAERRVNALLPVFLGPAEKYSTRVRGKTGALTRGRLRSVHIVGTGVELSPELTLDTLTLDLTGVDVDTKAGNLRSVESVAFGATLGEVGLNRYLRARRPDVPGLRVDIRGSEVIVHAQPEVLELAAVPIRVRGTVTPRGGGSTMDFTPGGANVSVVPIPTPVLGYLARRVNPIVDLSALRIPVRIERSDIRQGVLHLSGTVDPAALLRAGSAGSSSP